MTEPTDRGLGIEPLITQLVQSAPALDPAVVAALVEQLRGIGAPLALAIAKVIGLVAAEGRRGLIDAGIALPPLAMACATLAAGLRGELTERELEAARYEIETLLPLPAPARLAPAPDVPLTALRRRTP